MSLFEVKNLADRVPLLLRGACRGLERSLSAEKGEIVGVVGESGAGKSTIGNAVIDLLELPPGRIARGDISTSTASSSPEEQNEMRAILQARASVSSSRIP